VEAPGDCRVGGVAMSETECSAGRRLNELLAEAGLARLDAEQTARFEDYFSLFVRWNARVNLTSVRDENGILSRHFVESIACALALPVGIGTLLDFGSGGGFPGIPVAICRPEVVVTLAESQGKKAAFLREAVRVVGLPVSVHAERAELLRTLFDCVALRAVDKMALAVSAAARLVVPGGFLAVMTTRAAVAGLQAVAGAEFSWSSPVPLPGGEERILALGERRVSSPA
jgi:16S rRNA (guanine527-N7)-methyltransferase